MVSDRVNDDLSTLLSSFHFTELVHKPTRGKNLVDVVATDDPAAIFELKIDDCGLSSDHRLVVFGMKFRNIVASPSSTLTET